MKYLLWFTVQCSQTLCISGCLLVSRPAVSQSDTPLMHPLLDHGGEHLNGSLVAREQLHIQPECLGCDRVHLHNTQNALGWGILPDPSSPAISIKVILIKCHENYKPEYSLIQCHDLIVHLSHHLQLNAHSIAIVKVPKAKPLLTRVEKMSQKSKSAKRPRGRRQTPLLESMNSSRGWWQSTANRTSTASPALFPFPP